MSRILMITFSALMLAGCAASYDEAAVPDAAATMSLAMATCDRQQTPSKITACDVAAQRDFAVAIHLPKMDAFDTYAARMVALSVDLEAGRVSPEQMTASADSIRKEYWTACDCGLIGGRRYNLGGHAASRNPPYNYGVFVPSSNLMPPGVQLGPTPP